jgi:hypothetical protein
LQRRYLLDEELPRQEMRREFGILSVKRIGARTSLIVDPPNVRIPPLTPVAEKIAAAEREFRLAAPACRRRHLGVDHADVAGGRSVASGTTRRDPRCLQ